MRIGIKVGDIMTREVISVKPNMTLVDCAKSMFKNNVGLVVVKDKDKLKGVLTEKDIIWALTKKNDLSKIKARDIMLKKITTINPSRDIYDALIRMQGAKVGWLPVTAKGNVIGLLTLKDILKIEPSLFDIAKSNIQIREESEKMKRKRDALAGRNAWIKEGECEECGIYGLLYNLDGKLVCDQCEEDGF